MDDFASRVSEQRAIGVVISELVAVAQRAGADDAMLSRLRALIAADDNTLRASLATRGIDSLTWMALLTALENKFDVLFPDEVATGPEAYAVMGLARALADCLHDGNALSV